MSAQAQIPAGSYISIQTPEGYTEDDNVLEAYLVKPIENESDKKIEAGEWVLLAWSAYDQDIQQFHWLVVSAARFHSLKVQYCEGVAEVLGLKPV